MNERGKPMKKVIVEVEIGQKRFEGELLGIFQYSQPVGQSPLIHGHNGGTVAYPVAVVKVGNGLEELPVNRVRYL